MCVRVLFALHKRPESGDFINLDIRFLLFVPPLLSYVGIFCGAVGRGVGKVAYVIQCYVVTGINVVGTERARRISNYGG